MDKIKKIIDFIKDVYGNKRKRAIAGIIFWLGFMAVVLSMVKVPPSYRNNTPNSSSNASNINKTSDSALNVFNQMTSFEYNYLVEITDNNIEYKYVIKGTYYDDKYYFEINNDSYYGVNNEFYYVDSNSKTLKLVDKKDNESIFSKMDLEFLSKNSMFNIITSSEKKSETIYKDGNTVKKYAYIDHANRKINIVSTENNGIINNIVFDYIGYVNSSRFQLYKATCDFENINNIESFDKNYDDYTIIKEGE